MAAGDLFPLKDGQYPILKENENFTPETLQQIPPKKICAEMAKILVELYQNRNFGVVDVEAGIGGVTLALLSQKEILLVVSFSEDSYMLRNNITYYNLGRKSIVYSGKGNRNLD